jgi:hypothetical protein
LVRREPGRSPILKKELSVSLCASMMNETIKLL